MAPYHILIVIISSVSPENLVLLTKSEQSGPKSAHIRPTTRVDSLCLDPIKKNSVLVVFRVSLLKAIYEVYLNLC